MIKFLDDFEKNEWLGREALKEIKQLYPNYFKYELHFTLGKYDDYDSFYFIIDENQQIVKRVWIEIKVRNRDFDNYILEKKKLKQLIKKRKDMFFKNEEVSFLYISFTPSDTIIWDITNIDPDKTEKMVMNKTTCESTTNKINKDIILLDPKDGKILNYRINENLLMLKYDDNYLLPKIKKEMVRKPGLEQILFMN